MNAEMIETKAVDVSEDEYDTARTEQIGWCPKCEDFTTADVGPSETHVQCAVCGENDVVVGARHALHNGFVTVERMVLA